jgi:nicotinamide-nucleotide amidase
MKHSDTNNLGDLAEKLGAALKARGIKLALAESCTGGMVAEAITSVAGSSAWFDCGFVTYSNQAKMDMLGVSAQTLEKYGAVSEEIATEMVLGGLKNSHAQIAGSITGIAGPDGGTTDKPVGTVWLAWAGDNLPLKTKVYVFAGNRQQIRQQAAAALMAGFIEHLSKLQV